MSHFGKLNTTGMAIDRKHVEMRLINHHILLVGDFIPRPTDCLKQIEQELLGLDIVSRAIIQDNEYPFAANFLSEKLFVEVKPQDNLPLLHLEIFRDGFVIFELLSERFKNSIRPNDIIKKSEGQRETLQYWINKSEIITAIRKAFQSGENTDSEQLQLCSAWSQILLFKNKSALNTTFPGLKFGGLIHVDASFIKIVQSNGAETAIAISCLKTVILKTALLYHMQEMSLMRARRLLQNSAGSFFDIKFLNENKSWLSRYQHLYSVIIQQDFLSDFLEEKYARPTADAWELSNLSSKVNLALNELEDRLHDARDNISLRAQQRTNRILFAFTLLSIVGISTGLITMYDLSNNISPQTRVLLVSLVFGFASLFSIFLLKRK